MTRLVLSFAAFLSITALTAANASAQTQSQPACFELSRDGQAFSRTPERLCIWQNGTSNRYTIRLQTGMTPSDVVVFNFDLTERVRSADRNRDVFSLSNPSNSIFNELAIRFDGTRNVSAGTETGTVRVGSTTFHYRKVAHPSAAPPPAVAPSATS